MRVPTLQCLRVPEAAGERLGQSLHAVSAHGQLNAPSSFLLMGDPPPPPHLPLSGSPSLSLSLLPECNVSSRNGSS